MAFDFKESIDRLKNAKRARDRVVLYLDKVLFKQFQKACKTHGVSASRMTEDFMKDFVSTASESVDKKPSLTADIVDLLAPLNESERRGILSLIEATVAGKPSLAPKKGKKSRKLP